MRSAASIDRDRHDNHFNLLRLALAAGVLLSHCFPITQGPRGFAGEPWFVLTDGQRLLGTTCVLGFFIVSGYLVSASLQNSRHLKDYLLARALRIYPAAILCAVITAFLLGPLVSERPLAEYFSSQSVYRYAFFTSTFLSLKRDQSLPEMFPHNPLHAMNGSLWTIPWELLCYVILVPVGVLLYRQRSTAVRISAYLFVGACAVAGATSYAVRPFGLGFAAIAGFWGYFCIGILARAVLPRLPRSGALTALSVCLFLCLEFVGRYFPVVEVLNAFVLAYALLTAASTLPSRWLGFNRFGDFSYGLYLYAWPVQQTIVHVYPGRSAWELFFTAIPIALLLAAGSWHWIENPALRLKKRWTAKRSSSEPGLRPAFAGVSAGN